MKKFTAIICTLALLTAFTGCNNNETSGSAPENSGSVSAPDSNTENQDSSNAPESAPQSSEENSPADSAPTAPQGEPTFLIGLDGKPILTSEITRLENTDKTAETLTKDDLWADVYCDGFTYIKEPSGVAFNSYRNPEMFDGDDYLGERAENTNEWKRVYVGDEICGLKVKSAAANFRVNDYDNDRGEWQFPERYVSLHGAGECEFEGTVELEGFLQVFPNFVQYPDTSELVEFMPCEGKLPITPGYPDRKTGYITPLEEKNLYNHFDDFGIFGELGSIKLGYLGDQTCDMDGMGSGDIAYARVTLGNIKCAGGGISATLENVERISDILMHDEDETEYHQPAPTR